MRQRPPRVFISYSHDTVEHQDRVLGLADRLRADGIEAEVDQYNAAPPEGWPLWCERQIATADVVLMVCTETYYRRVSGNEERGKGLGVVWEAHIIRQLLYDAGAVSDKFVPVLFSDASPEHIPTPIKGWTRYVVDTEDGYEDLYRRLTGQPRILRPTLGTIRTLPPRQRQWPEDTMMEAATISAPQPASRSSEDRGTVTVGRKQDIAPLPTSRPASQETNAQAKRTPEEPASGGKVANGSGLSARQTPLVYRKLSSIVGVVALLILSISTSIILIMKPEQDQQPDFTIFRDAPFAPEMVVLPNGEFLMGSIGNDHEAYANEKPQHLVQIGYRLAVGRYPVTFEEWDTYVADGGTDYQPDDAGWGRGQRPVINVSWNDAKQYVTWLSRKTGQTYRLLSEAEWEYAARAGTTASRWWGRGITPQHANYSGNMGGSTEVGNYSENPFKLYDMLGNVWEWVEDCWNESYTDAPESGAAWTTGDCSQRVLRGGAWYDYPWSVRSASRSRGPADKQFYGFGFRVARAL